MLILTQKLFLERGDLIVGKGGRTAQTAELYGFAFYNLRGVGNVESDVLESAGKQLLFGLVEPAALPAAR